MKIENNGINSLGSKATDGVERSEAVARKTTSQAVNRAESRDKAEVSANARLLAKARVALDGTQEVDSERVQSLKKQVESGDYKLQVEDVALKLKRLFR